MVRDRLPKALRQGFPIGVVLWGSVLPATPDSPLFDSRSGLVRNRHESIYNLRGGHRFLFASTLKQPHHSVQIRSSHLSDVESCSSGWLRLLELLHFLRCGSAAPRLWRRLARPWRRLAWLRRNAAFFEKAPRTNWLVTDLYPQLEVGVDSSCLPRHALPCVHTHLG